MEKNLVHSNLDFLKTLERFTLESKLLTCQIYSSRIMTCSMVDLGKAYKENVMPWEIEAFAAYSIVYDLDTATEKMDLNTFLEMINLIRNYWHKELSNAEEKGIYPEIFMMISTLQQVPVQGLILQKLFRYHYFFTFENNNINMKSVFKNKMGIDYERLEKFSFTIFICFNKDSQNIIPGEKLQKILTKIFLDHDVLKLITIGKEEYRNKLSSLYGDNIIDQYYGLKIQYIYPLISSTSMTYIPSPYLIINAVTESMLNRITFQDDKLRKVFGKEVIESYLFEIISQLDTVTWISSETEYSIGKNKKLTSDVIAAEDDNVVFYDSKALSPSLKIRKFDEEEINKEIEIYAENVLQIYYQIEDYIKGHFNLDNEYKKDNIFGIVVVLEDAAVSREKVYDKAISLLSEKFTSITEEVKHYIISHIKVLPLREIELMILQNTSLLPYLEAQAKKPRDWYNYTYANPTTENGLIPIYEEYITKLKKKASFKI